MKINYWSKCRFYAERRDEQTETGIIISHDEFIFKINQGETPLLVFINRTYFGNSLLIDVKHNPRDVANISINEFDEVVIRKYNLATYATNMSINEFDKIVNREYKIVTYSNLTLSNLENLYMVKIHDDAKVTTENCKNLREIRHSV